MLSCNFPSVVMKIQKMIPISLMTTKDAPQNCEILATLRLYGFAYRLVSSYCSSKDPNSQLLKIYVIHRLIKSGRAAVDAFISAMIANDREFWSTFNESKKYNKFLMSTAVTCAISCIELPLTKIFVQKYVEELLSMFYFMKIENKDIHLMKTINKFYSALHFTSYSPLSLLFNSWISKKPQQLLAMVMSMSENDEYFAPLVVEAAKEIVASNNINLAPDIATNTSLFDFILSSRSLLYCSFASPLTEKSDAKTTLKYSLDIAETNSSNTLCLF
jgi:disulfide oxidoreductase YuzD